MFGLTSALGERNGRPLLDSGTALLFQDGSASHEDPLAVHQTEGSQASLLLVRVQGHVRVRWSLAVAVGVEMRSPFESHMDGLRMRMLSGNVKLVQTRMPVFGPQMRRIEGAADGRQKVVSSTARLALAAQLMVVVSVVVVVMLQWNQRPTVAVGTRRLAADVAAVLAPIFITQIRRLLVVQDGRTSLELVLLVVAAGAEVATAASGVAFNLLVNRIGNHSVFLFFRLFRQGFAGSSRPSQVNLHVRVVPG